MHDQRVGGGRAPVFQPDQGFGQPRIRLRRGVQDPLQVAGPPGQFGHLGLDGLLGRGKLFEAFLLGPVDVALLNPVVSADHQIEPHEQLQIRAEPVLHRQPHVPVDVLAPGGQPHEQVVAQQVGLAQLKAGVVQGLEDPVHVVAALGGDLDNRQSRPDRLLDTGDVLVIVWVIHAP